jgi:RNA 3'-phosphate cyclase
VFADQRTNLTVKGGTAVKWSPPIPFLENVVYKAFNTMGINLITHIDRHGFYPKGGGITNVVIEPAVKIKALNSIKPLKNPRINGVSLCGRLPYHVAKRQAKTAQATIRNAGFNANIESYSLQGNQTPLSPGSLISLWVEDEAYFLGTDSLGERGKPAEKVGQEAAQSMLSQIKTSMTVDRNTTDHLILPVSLAKGRTEFTTSEITLHTLTAIELAKTFTGSEFKLSGKLGEPGRIICSGQ